MSREQRYEQMLAALQRIALLADSGSDAHKQEFASFYESYDKPTGWRVAERMREIANDVVGDLPIANACTVTGKNAQTFKARGK